MKTSQSHPLRIAEVIYPAGGLIGLTFCPGKQQPDGLSGAWHRDLGTDLDAIRIWGASVVISLIEDHEIRDMRVDALGRECARRGLAWLHLPIADVSVPDPAWEEAWLTHRDELHRRLLSGERLLVH